MPDWRNYYNPPQIDWDALENWWPWEENVGEVRAFYEQLLQDVPKKVIENGLDQIERHAEPRSVDLRHWRRGAEILALGELEAAVEGPPESMTELWARRSAEMYDMMAEVVIEESSNDPATELSAKWYAQNASNLLDQIERYTLIAEAGADEHDDDPEARRWMREIISEAVAMAFEAGISVRAASTKKFDVHAIRGMKVLRGAQASARLLPDPNTQERLAHMDEVYRRTNNISAAARSAAQKFPGTSFGSNRALFHRHRPHQPLPSDQNEG